MRWVKLIGVLFSLLLLVGCARRDRSLGSERPPAKVQRPDVEQCPRDSEEVSGRSAAPTTASAEEEAKPEDILRKAEDCLQRASLSPPTDDGNFFPYSGLDDAEESLRELVSFGLGLGSYQEWLVLGRVQMALGKYGTALDSFERALYRRGDDPVAQSRLREAREREEVVRVVEAGLPVEQQVAQADEFNVSKGRSLWLVLTADVGDDEWPMGPGFSDVYLSLHEDTGLRLARIWQSGQLFGHAASPDGWFTEARLHVTDLTADGVPEAVVGEVNRGASWAPSHLDVFAWRSDRLTKILGVSSSAPVCIKGINKDGRYEVSNYYEIGWGLCHAEQPRWTDIYAYESGRYLLANKHFPKEFRHWPGELREVLEEHPDDFEIWKYLGIAHDILRQPKEALAAYRRAEKACNSQIEQESDAEWRAKLDWHAEDIEKRIQSLSRTGK